MHIVTVNISQTVTDRANIAIATNKKSHTAFLLEHLYMTLAHSKGQGQGYAHFDCGYLANGNR